jgi:phosphatidylinositol 4-kinase
LELNIRQRILSDLVTLEPQTEEDLLTTRDLIQSKAQLADEKHSVPNGDLKEREVEPRAFMVRGHSTRVPQLIMSAQSVARAHCNIAFGELVANFPEEHIAGHIDTLIPVLTDLLHDVPQMEFDRCLSWDGMSSLVCCS